MFLFWFVFVCFFFLGTVGWGCCKGCGIFEASYIPKTTSHKKELFDLQRKQCHLSNSSKVPKAHSSPRNIQHSHLKFILPGDFLSCQLGNIIPSTCSPTMIPQSQVLTNEI